MAPAQVSQTRLEELPIETRSVKALQLQQLKRSFDLFASNYGSKPDLDTGRSALEQLSQIYLWAFGLLSCGMLMLSCGMLMLAMLFAAKKPS